MTAADALQDGDVTSTEPEIEVKSPARINSANEQAEPSFEADGEGVLDEVQAEFKELQLGSEVEDGA